jgi:NAD(P)-dependent dehydrogenase (short-subunit alcohol dehydrogenase family)
LVRTTASYYAPEAIRVNAVAPGLVATPMAARAAGDPATVAYAASKQPLACGLLEPEDVGDAALFLLSPEARRITGQVLAVDGGWSVVEGCP